MTESKDRRFANYILTIRSLWLSVFRTKYLLIKYKNKENKFNNFASFNKFEILPVEPDVVQPEYTLDPYDPCKLIQKKKINIFNHDRLHDIIKCPVYELSGNFKDPTNRKYRARKSSNVINFQMDDAHSQDGASVKCTESGNVIFLDEAEKSVGKSQIKFNKSIKKMAHGDPNHDIPIASQREVILDTFEWGSVDSETLIKRYIFPACIMQLVKNTPNGIPFKMSTFMSSDLEINIRVNSNKFQVGSLQCSFLYDPLCDKNLKKRLNIYSLSQAPHCLINAGSSNVGTLLIPFVSTYAALPTIATDDVNNCLNLGELYIFVLNRLSSPDSVAKSCSVTISVKLVDPEFYGLKDSNIGNFVYPQMMEGTVAAVAGAELLLNTIKNSERDNPPYNGPSQKMVPQSNQSFCLGDQLVEPLSLIHI